MTQYNYKHVTFYTRSLEKANGSVLEAFLPHLSRHKQTLGVTDTLLMDYRNQHSVWFSFEKKSQFQITAQKLEGKQPAYVLGAAPLSLTNRDFGRLTGTWWPHEIYTKQSRSL